jgi:hypothetical protein
MSRRLVLPVTLAASPPPGAHAADTARRAIPRSPHSRGRRYRRLQLDPPEGCNLVTAVAAFRADAACLWRTSLRRAAPERTRVHLRRRHRAHGVAGVIAAALTAATATTSYVVSARLAVSSHSSPSRAGARSADARRWRVAVALGAAVSFAGAWTATIYAFDWPAEAYAVGIAAMAPALALAIIAAQDERVARQLPAHLSDAAYVTAIGATVAAAVVALLTLLASAEKLTHTACTPLVPRAPSRSRWLLRLMCAAKRAKP